MNIIADIQNGAFDSRLKNTLIDNQRRIRKKYAQRKILEGPETLRFSRLCKNPSKNRNIFFLEIFTVSM